MFDLVLTDYSLPRRSGGCQEPVELILYVNAASPRSAAAIARIRQVIRGFKSTRVTLTIHDLSRGVAADDLGAVAFTLARGTRSRALRTFILAHTATPDVLLELLEECEQGVAS